MPLRRSPSGGLRRRLPFLAGLGLPGTGRGTQQSGKDGYPGRIFNPIRQSLAGA